VREPIAEVIAAAEALYMRSLGWPSPPHAISDLDHWAKQLNDWQENMRLANERMKAALLDYESAARTRGRR
jgi:hypothetical protein